MNKVQINNMPTLTYSTEEAINRLRVNLNFQAKDMRKIMVISSTENEGKSFVAFHTWKQMAESGIHTLLLDADMRKSVMAEKYQMEAEGGKKLTGTSHVLSKGIPLKDAVWHTVMPQGDILPNVENLVNPAMLLESDTFHSLLDEASEEYRYIFIDAPPLDLVSDGEKIGSLCDGAILVVASGKVSRSMVQNSIHQLKRAGCPLLGIVLNRVEDQRKKNYYQKYGYYASEKGKKK
jgi:protein-tyrosine kinase